MSEILSIARSSSSVVRFYEKTNALITQMEKKLIAGGHELLYFCL